MVGIRTWKEHAVQRIHTDCVVIENPRIRADWKSRNAGLDITVSPNRVPEGVTKRVENAAALDEVKRAKDLACVDIVIATIRPDGQGAVLLSKRRKSDPFGGFWWVYGGSLGAYMPIDDFIAARAEKECGVPVRPEVLLGVYRTSAADFPQSTLQPCYASLVPYEAIERKMRADENHESVRLFSFEDLDEIPVEEGHWYPLRVARMALLTLPTA